MVDVGIYFDESGTHEGSEVLTIASYLSLPWFWERFSEHWARALSDFRLEYFRMSKFANHQPPYDTWSEERRRACFTRLTGIIHDNVIGSSALSIPMKAYRSLPVSNRFLRMFGGPYGFALGLAFADVAILIRVADENGWGAYVFESGANGAGQIVDTFARMNRNETTREDMRLRSLSFQNKRQTLPLQAADILAYEVCKEESRKIAHPERPPRAFDLGTLAAVQHRWQSLDEETLTGMVKAFGGEDP